MFEQLIKKLSGQESGQEKGKEKRERVENPELDIAKQKLEELQRQVGIPQEQAAREFRDSLIADLRQLGITDIREQARYLEKPMRLFDQLKEKRRFEHGERMAQKTGLTVFLEKPGTYDKKLASIIDSKNPEKAAKKWAKEAEKKGKKQGFLAGLIGGWLMNWANELKEQNKGKDTWLGKNLKKLASFLGFEKEKEDKEVKGEKSPEAVAESELKKDMEDLKGALRVNDIPCKDFGLEEYKKILELSKFGGKPEKLLTHFSTALKEKGTIGTLNRAVLNRRELDDFEFRLKDFLLDEDETEHIRNVIDGKDEAYEVKDLTPQKLRTFMDAVRTGIGLTAYEKKEEKSEETTA